MYFSDGFPILVTNAGIPQFTFFDEGQATATRFERYLRQYQPLFAVARRIRTDLCCRFREQLCTGKSHLQSLSARGPAARRHTDDAAGCRSFPRIPCGPVCNPRRVAGGSCRSDLKILREGESLYTSLEHQALYSAWKMGSTSADKIRKRFLQSSMRVTFSTVILPYGYPLDLARPDNSVDEDGNTHHDTHDDTPSEEATDDNATS